MGWFDSLYQSASENPDALARLAASFTPKRYRPAATALSGMAGMYKAKDRQNAWNSAYQKVDTWEEAKKNKTTAAKPTGQDIAMARRQPPKSAFDIGIDTAGQVGEDYRASRSEDEAQEQKMMQQSAARLQTRGEVIPPKTPNNTRGQGNQEELLRKLVMMLMQRQGKRDA